MTDIDMPTTLVALVRELDSLESHQRTGFQGQALREKIRLVGLAASFFGGYDGMKKLHDAAEALAGNDDSIGSRLNYLWDHVGGCRAS